MSQDIQRDEGAGFDLETYATELTANDEMWDGNGVRPHWSALIDGLGKQGADTLVRHRQEARRLLRENGVTYNVYGDPNTPSRPWELDLIPLVFDHVEWAHIEKGLTQRALLLDRIFADLYGPRNLIAEGLLPPELVYGSGAFLLPCDQMPQHRLSFYATDLARGPDGRMWVLSDRTQSPLGAGYALENRTAMRRLMPQLTQDCQVRRLSFFFQAVRDQLQMSAKNKDQPRIALLTPGPLDEAYFEHAYMASYLGYPLVQGGDLTVRDGCVWLKSIEGLKQVDILLRRVDDRNSDPLELRGDGPGGVAGLLEAVRQGNAVVANPLGSSALENPGLLPFLPRIARHFFGDDLELPSAATWWCGHESACRYVLEHLDELVIKSTRRSSAHPSVLGANLSAAERDALRRRIEAAPHLYVGQERVSFSTTPTLIEDRLEPRHAILRSFLVAHEEGYIAMPGGLTRVAPDRDSFVVTTQAGGISKDTWVLSEEPERSISLWRRPGDQEELRAYEGVLPSRAGENLFWVGRYAERAEGLARLLRVILERLHSGGQHGDEAEVASLHQLLRAVTRMTGTLPGFVGRGAKQRLLDPWDELRAVVLTGSEKGSSLLTTLKALQGASYAIRDRWSTDAWRIIDDIQEHWTDILQTPFLSSVQVQDDLDLLLTDLLALSGLNKESMTRETGWLLLDIGRRIERGQLLISLVRSTLVPRTSELEEHLLLDAVLYAKQSLITYRRRYRSYLQLGSVLELLLVDETNPRSLVYQFGELQEHIKALPRTYRVGHLSEEERLVLEAHTRLRLIDPAQMAAVDENKVGKRRELDKLLADMGKALTATSETLTRTYFSHSQTSSQLVPTVVDEAP